MDNTNSTIISAERKSGHHLGAEERGAIQYLKKLGYSNRAITVPRESVLLRWMAKQVRVHKWSFDACVGYARLHKLFSSKDIPCTKTLYNLLWNR